MATAEEILKSLQSETNITVYASEPEILTIDSDSRTINVPASERLFGVKGDMNIERKYFRCPKIVGDNIDLSQHQIFIAYVYTETESGSIFPTVGVAPYHCEDVEIDGEDITFSWKLTGNVFENPGFILFKMYAKRTETDPNTVFNTTPAIGTVLATIPDGTEEIVEEYPDVIAQIFDRLDALESGGGTGGTTNYENLSNKPQLNGVTLEGNKTLDQVGVLAKNQGSNNSGKFLSVGSDGNVVPADAPSGGTVDPEQIKQAVNGYLEENPVSGMTAEQEQQLNQNTTDVADLKSAVQQPIEYEKLGFGKTCRYGKGYFTGNIVDEMTQVYGSFGVIIECSAGETLYCNFSLSANNINSVQILDNVPKKNYGALTGVIGTLKEQEDGVYKIPDNLKNAKAAYFPQKFLYYPQYRPEQWDNVEKTTVQSQAFNEFPAFYNSSLLKNPQSESLFVDQDKNMVIYASLFKSVSDMVGAKVYVSGDSITEQSATVAAGDDALQGWYDKIAIKYMQQYECHGYGGQMWYSTTSFQKSAVADVKKIIESGIVYDYVVLEWGTNDITRGVFGNATDAASDKNDCGTVAAMRWCIENLQSNLPNARIIVIMPCMRNAKVNKQEQYYELVDPILKSYGVRRVYMAWDSGITINMMNSDGIHLRYQDESGAFRQCMTAIEKYSKCLEAEMLKA